MNAETKRKLYVNMLSVTFGFIWVIVIIQIIGISNGKRPVSWVSLTLYLLLWIFSLYLIRQTSLGQQINIFFLPYLLLRLLLFFSLSMKEVTGEREKLYIIRYKLPTKVYVGESILILLEISYTHQTSSGNALPGDLAEIMQETGISVYLDAPSFEISKENQKANIGPIISSRTVSWNALPKISGNQTVLFRFYGTIFCEYEASTMIRVNKIDGLTANQIWVLGAVFGIISGLFGILNILKGVFFK